MHDSGEARVLAVGDYRAGVTLAAAGALLLGTITTGVWTGWAAVPAALAVALLVFGSYLVTLRAGVARLRGVGAARLARYHEDSLDPVLVTDLGGRILARNPAARGEAVADGDGLRHRLAREAVLNGTASEETPDGRQRILVTRAAARWLLWRIERVSPAVRQVPGLRESGVPWLRVDPAGTVVAANAAATALGDGQPTLERLLADLPLRPDGVHRLAGSGEAVRAVVIADDDGTRDLLLMPLNGAEVSGLVPDHFLDELPVALARLTPEGGLTYANRAARALLGPGAGPGVALPSLIEGLGRPIAERIADTGRGRALGRSEVARGTLAGQEIFLQVAFTRAVLDGTPSILAVFSDATELKTLEAQFVQSQKMQAVGQLAGGVAHDFNNLLTAINGHCDLLLMRHDVADVEHGDLMQIRQNANRAAALVRQLLAFSRKQTLRPTVINLQDTLSELTHLLNRLLTDKVTLRIEHAPDLAPVRVDERQLEQVIMNLVVNARDAMPRGGEVRIATRNVHLGRDLHRDRAVILRGDYVVIEVADSGHGIPEAQLNKIFEPFFTTKQVGEGTGLGLSTAYGIIKQTGGFIFADSPAGQGAIFTHLPAAPTTRSRPRPSPSPRSAARATSPAAASSSSSRTRTRCAASPPAPCACAATPSSRRRRERRRSTSSRTATSTSTSCSPT